VLRKITILKLVLEFVVVDVVLVFTAHEDHQIIVSIYMVLVSTLVYGGLLGVTDR
jgi:hypothetical protein